MKFESDLRYTRFNEWAKKTENLVRVGIDDYSQSSLGDIVYVEISEAGKQVKSGDILGRIEATKSVTDIISPVSGLVVKVNSLVLEKPATINLDPFGEGWLAEIQAEKLSEYEELMTLEEYKKFISK